MDEKKPTEDLSSQTADDQPTLKGMVKKELKSLVDSYIEHAKEVEL